MDSQYSTWSTEESQEVDHNDLDNHTMAYSIPTQPPAVISPSRREYLESTMQEDDDDDDDEDYHGFSDERNRPGGRTEEFFRKLEHGFPSTITQDIEKLKREREARASFGGRSDGNTSADHSEGSSRKSFRPSSRGSWASNPSQPSQPSPPKI